MTERDSDAEKVRGALLEKQLVSITDAKKMKSDRILARLEKCEAVVEAAASFRREYLEHYGGELDEHFEPIHDIRLLDAAGMGFDAALSALQEEEVTPPR